MFFFLRNVWNCRDPHTKSSVPTHRYSKIPHLFLVGFENISDTQAGLDYPPLATLAHPDMAEGNRNKTVSDPSQAPFLGRDRTTRRPGRFCMEQSHTGHGTAWNIDFLREGCKN